MTAERIGEEFRKLREGRGLRQADLGLIPGLDQAAVSNIERGVEVGRMVKHAPMLVEIMGPHVWPLVCEALATTHLPADWKGVGPCARALCDLLADRTEQVQGNTEPVTWRFTFPTLEQVAAKLGWDGPLPLQESLHLAGVIELTGLMRGWPRAEVLSESARRRRIKRLQAEIERLSK